MKEVLNEFINFENENKVFEYKIDDIYFWYLIRRRISDNILISKKLISTSDYTTGNNIVEKALYFSKYLLNAFFNLFKKVPHVDEIIINHPRKIIVDGKYIDIYTYYLENDLREKGINFITLDVPLNWHKHLLKKEKHIRYMENFSIIKKIIFNKLNAKKIKQNEILQKLSKQLIAKFGDDGNLISVVNLEIQKFKDDYKYFKHFLKKANPKKISIVISEVYPGIIAAAKELGIETVEIQHAVITKEHLAYEYPNQKNIPYFPDKIRLFGEYWYDTVDLPLEKKDIVLTENKFLTSKRNEKVSKKNNQILFITQGWVTKKMLIYIQKFIKKTSKYHIVVKLHPSEYEVWQKIYPELVELKENFGIEVVDNFNKSIYDWLIESKYVVGVSSTCLYEALFFDCEVHLLNLPSVEIMSDLIDKKLAKLANNAQELAENIKTKSKGKIDLNYIYFQGGKNNENR